MSNKQPSFAERCQLLNTAARDLSAIAELVAEEALRMAAAQERFAERRPAKAKAGR